MSVKLHSYTLRGWPVLEITGELQLGCALQLNEAYDRTDRSLGHLFLDLGKMEYISSSGVAILVQFLNHTGSDNVQVHFCGLKPYFERMMGTIGLLDFVKLHRSLEQAMDSLA